MVFLVAERSVKKDNARNSRELPNMMDKALALLASIVADSDDAIISKTLDGIITSWNRSATKLYGYREEEAVGQPMSILIPPNSRDELPNILNRIMNGERIDHFETVRRRKDGTLVNVSLTISPIKDSNGSIIGASTIARDITEMKRAEESVKLANSYNRSLIEASLDPLVTIAPDGKITDVNRATEAVTGYMREKLIGTYFSSYFTDPEKAKEGYLKVFETGSVIDYQLEIRHRDGHIVPVLYNASVYKDNNGNIIGVFAAARDITERKHAEEAIRQASAYNRSLIEASMDPLVTIAPDGKITDVNLATEAVTGYSRQALIGTDFSNYFTDPEKAREGYLEAFEKGSVKDYPLEIRNKNGRITPVIYNASVYRNEAGKVIGVFAAARDITERKKAEEAVRLAYAYNRSLIEAGLDPLVTIAPDGKITDVNKATEMVTGLPRDHLIGTDFSMYFTEPGMAQEGYLKVFKEGSVKDYPLEMRHRDGHTTPVLYNASVYRDEMGKVIGVFAAARDITERKHAEEAVRQAYAYNRSLIEASLDPLVTISPDGKITDVNEATEKVTGRSREDLIGTIFSNYFTRPDKAQEGYLQVYKEGVVTDYPLEIRHIDGHITPVVYNASLYRDESDRVIGVFAAARDVTELFRTEEALKAKMVEVERSNAELEQFAYVASHDLQEPLRVVASYVKLLDRRYGDKLDADAHEFIGYAVEGSTRMQQMINDLLTFSRVGTKGKPFEPTDLESVFDRALKNLSVSIRDNDAKVTHDALPSVVADDMQMTQLFQNLVGNAIKFRSMDRAPAIHVSAKKLGGAWEFSVADNGIGIEPEYFNRIFVIFNRLHTKDEYPGSGIGLAICKKIVERHGGRIWVESRPDEGSVFHFTIPVRLDEKLK
jgi:PAS domain S-box-containing protein